MRKGGRSWPTKGYYDMMADLGWFDVAKGNATTNLDHIDDCGLPATTEKQLF